MLIFSEQVLHLWLETLCSCVDVVEKWYHPWSFMRSPGWVQIKCELRLVPNFTSISAISCREQILYYINLDAYKTIRNKTYLSLK
jgi:hypothetical protein